MTKQDREEARERLLAMLKPGDTITCVLRHVSRSGMTRWIDLYYLDAEDAGRVWLSPLAARAIGETFDTRRECIKIGGCGMDMGFALVYDLGRVLWPEGGPVEHSSRRWQEERDGNTIERDGGYLLHHEWL